MAPYTVVGAGSPVSEAPYGPGDGAFVLESLSLSDLTGRPNEIPLAPEDSYLLLFADVRCPTCGDVVAWLERNVARLPEATRLVIIATGVAEAEVPASLTGGASRGASVSLAQAREIVRGWGLQTVVYFDRDDRLASRLSLRASSAVFLVERQLVKMSLRLAKSTPVHHPDVLDLLVGASAPSFFEESLQDLRPARVKEHTTKEE